MGQSQSAFGCCTAAPSDKYELKHADELKVPAKGHIDSCTPAKRQGSASGSGKDGSLKGSKAAGKLAPEASEARGESSVSTVGDDALPAPEGATKIQIGGAFSTTDPAQVAPELAPQAGLPYQFHICGPPPPPCDDVRLRTIDALKNAGSVRMDADAIDAPPDPEIASILKLVQSIFEAPAALVALFDDRRIFIRDSEGAFKKGDFPWRWSFCGWTMASKNDQIMVIPDATKDPRFCNNAMVTQDGGVRFYCGTPLLASNGHRIGTLCFADTRPREFDASRCVVLNNLAELVVRHLEKDIALQLRAHDNNSLAAAYGHLRRTLDCFDHCVALVDTGCAGWRILFVNSPCCKLLGIEREGLQGSYVSRLLAGVDHSMLPTDTQQISADAGREFTVQARLSFVVMEELEGGNKGGEYYSGGKEEGRRFQLTFRPASREDLDKGAISIGVPSFIPIAKSGNSEDSAKPMIGKRTDRLYFMLVQDAVKLEAERAAAKAKAAQAAAAAAAATASQASGISGQSHTTVGSSIHDRELWQLPESIGGLTMGHLLGKGAYGSVYYGTWYSTPVAVKIIEEELPAGAESIAPPIEAILSKELRHPHVVATLRCARRVVGPSGSSYSVSGSVSAAIAAARGGLKSGRENKSGNFSDDTALARSGAASGVTRDGGSITSGHGTSGATKQSGESSASEAGWLPEPMGGRNSAGARGGVANVSGNASTASASTGQGGVTNSSSTAPPSTPSEVASVQPSGGSEVQQPQGDAAWAIIAQPAAAEAVKDSGYDSDAGSEVYDTFDNVGRDSNMSPFLMPPGSAHDPAGAAPVPGAQSSEAHSNTSKAERWDSSAHLVRHQTWLLMEYCDRGCLQDAIDRGWLRTSPNIETSQPKLEAVLATGIEIASALSFLHAKDIVHGDLSAWNVMLCTSGPTAAVGGRNFVAKIADFGLARHLDIRTKIQTRTYGTLTHMPAETLRDGMISKSVDVYSFGVLMWQLYTSSRPWAGLRHGQIIVMVVTQGARLRFPPGCPVQYEALALSCMESDPANRPTIEHVLRELEGMRTTIL